MRIDYNEILSSRVKYNVKKYATQCIDICSHKYKIYKRTELGINHCVIGIGMIEVSVICNTYNHDNYIRDALEGFLMQETNFEYEVLIHDDASTDNTADIIREYTNKYPTIIKPIFQTENQYSKGIVISETYQFPRAKGKYLAFCEGDDYWSDPHKLQKQYDLMEQHLELDISAHSSTSIDAKSGKEISIISPLDHTGVISAEDVIRGGGGFVSTNTLMIRSDCNKNEPRFRQVFGYDYTIQVHGSLRGGMLFINDNMSVYRVMVSDSWSHRMRHSKQYRLTHYNRLMEIYRLMDEDTQGKYHWLIKRMQIKNTIRLLLRRLF